MMDHSQRFEKIFNKVGPKLFWVLSRRGDDMKTIKRLDPLTSTHFLSMGNNVFLKK
ncbi:MAG: hypothetical protein CM15mP70_18180 [Pelagibacteraceae bacterium]|nr:MAG: hypothetical protein CM15mP70_18180 [Pelagibacteraceae bacterium]